MTMHAYQPSHQACGHTTRPKGTAKKHKNTHSLFKLQLCHNGDCRAYGKVRAHLGVYAQTFCTLCT